MAAKRSFDELKTASLEPIGPTLDYEDMTYESTCPASSCHPTRNSERAPRLLQQTRNLLTIWAVLSVAWTAIVAIDLCSRADAQAKAALDVERDLAVGGCQGSGCEAAGGSLPTEGWSDIVETYMRFGSRDIAEWTAGPPTALLLLGSGGMLIFQRRRRRGNP